MKGPLSAGLRYLTVHKRRTLLTVLGIALSVSLVCGTSLIGSSIRRSGLNYARRTYGSLYAEIGGLNGTQVDLLKGHAGVDRMGLTVDLGIQRTDGVRVFAEARDPESLALSNLALAEGRWPGRGAEVAMERWALPLFGTTLGGSVTLEPTPHPARTYTVVGIVENRPWSQEASSALAVTALDGVVDTDRAATRWRASITTARGLPIQETLTQISTALGVSEERVRQNVALLTALRESVSPRSL